MFKLTVTSMNIYRKKAQMQKEIAFCQQLS